MQDRLELSNFLLRDARACCGLVHKGKESMSVICARSSRWLWWCQFCLGLRSLPFRIEDVLMEDCTLVVRCDECRVSRFHCAAKRVCIRCGLHKFAFQGSDCCIECLDPRGRLLESCALGMKLI